jgi:hypothetical protein
MKRFLGILSLSALLAGCARSAAVLAVVTPVVVAATPALAASDPYSWAVPKDAAIKNATPVLPAITPEAYYLAADGADDLPSWNRAKAYAASHSGTCIVAAARRYNFSATFTLDTAGLCVIGQGSASTLIAPSAINQVVIRVTASSVRLSGFGVADLAGKNGMTCFFVGPSDPATTGSQQNYLDFSNLSCEQADEGIEFRPGATGSQIYFGSFSDFWCRSCVRTIWMATAPTTGTNGNSFFNINAVSLGGHGSNVYIQIDDGDGNSFHGGSANGIQSGGSPIATPTTIYMGPGATYNKFFGGRFENSIVARSLYNNGAGNQFYGQSWPGNGTWILSVFPAVILCADASQCPTVIGGVAYEANSQLPGIYQNSVTMLIGSSGSCTQPAASGTPVSCATLGGSQEFGSALNGGPGGGTVNFAIPWAYVLQARYVVYIEAFDRAGSAVYQKQALDISEVSSGTFSTPVVFSDTGAVGAISAFAYTFGRSGGNITVAVSANLAGALIPTYKVTMEQKQ